jgi:hypothetical protein
MGIFGQAGLVLEKYLRQLYNVFLLQDLHGLFPPLTYQKECLDYPGKSTDQPKELLELFGKSLTDFVCGSVDLDVNSVDPQQPSTVFQGVCDDQTKIRQAFRTFLAFRTISVSYKFI